jgi:hypothetical protein
MSFKPESMFWINEMTPLRQYQPNSIKVKVTR